MSNAFCGNPFGIFLDAPGITAYTGTWAALVKVKPTARSYVMAAVYNGDPTIRANKYHGVNFRSTASLRDRRGRLPDQRTARRQPTARQLQAGRLV